MRAGANILWFVLGGFVDTILWLVASAIMFVSIVGIPWGRAAFEIAKMSAVPFGKEAVPVSDLTGERHLGWSAARLVGNILWLPLGIILCVAHLLSAVVCFVTIIGIPFGLQHLKLASISLVPVGKRVVSVDVAQLAAAEKADKQLAKYRARA